MGALWFGQTDKIALITCLKILNVTGSCLKLEKWSHDMTKCQTSIENCLTIVQKRSTSACDGTDLFEYFRPLGPLLLSVNPVRVQRMPVTIQEPNYN